MTWDSDDATLQTTFINALISLSAAQQAWQAHREETGRGTLPGDKEVEGLLLSAGYVIRPGVTVSQPAANDFNGRGRLFVADILAYATVPK